MSENIDVNIGFVEYRTDVKTIDDLTTGSSEIINSPQCSDIIPDTIQTSVESDGLSEFDNKLSSSFEISGNVVRIGTNGVEEINERRIFHETSACDLYVQPEKCIKETLLLQEDSVIIPDAKTFIKPDHVSEVTHAEIISHRHSTSIEGQIDHTSEVMPVVNRNKLKIDQSMVNHGDHSGESELPINHVKHDEIQNSDEDVFMANEEKIQEIDLLEKNITKDKITKVVAQSSLDKEFDKLLTDIEHAQHDTHEHIIVDHNEDTMDTADLMNEYDEWHDRLVAESNTDVAVVSTDEILSQRDASHVLNYVLSDDGVELTEDLEKCLTPDRDCSMTVATTNDMTVEVKESDEEEIVLEEEVTEQEITFLFTWPKNLKRPPNPMPPEMDPFREIHLRRVTRIKDVDLIVEDPQVVCLERGKVVDSPTTAKKIKDSSKSKIVSFTTSGSDGPHVCTGDDESIKVENVIYKKQVLTPAANKETDAHGCIHVTTEETVSSDATMSQGDTNIDDDLDDESNVPTERRSSYRVTNL